MSWVAVAGAAAGVIGGMMQSDAATDAANMQAQAGKYAADQALKGSREANQLTADIYKQGLKTGAPVVQGGQLALSALMSGMGLGGARAAPGAGSGFRAPRPVGVAMNAAGKPVDAQGNEILDYGISDLNYGATQEQLDAAGNPFAGTFNEQFTGQDLYIDPSYKWRLEQGQADLNARRAATGNRFGSQALKDITNYGQNKASEEYGAANERFLKNKSLLFDRLSNIAGIGAGAGNAAASAGTSAADRMSGNLMSGIGSANDYMTGAASAQARGRIGSTQAIVGGLGQGLNNYYTMDALRGGGGTRPMYETPYTDQGMWDRANQYQEG